MAQQIKTALTTANYDLLNQQLRAALPTVCDGFFHDRNGLFLVMKDEATQADINTALAIATAHDPVQETSEQAAARTGKTDTANLLAAADKALADLVEKTATFQATPNLANAAPLLLELSQDLQAAIKMLKHVARKID
jgi:hypothetical protein